MQQQEQPGDAGLGAKATGRDDHLNKIFDLAVLDLCTGRGLPNWTLDDPAWGRYLASAKRNVRKALRERHSVVVFMKE